ncbi:MAG: winged helix-turn-helix domain-containing protein [Desulfovermiculus sp.]
MFCEPQLSKRGLYPGCSTKSTKMQVKTMMDLLSYCDGSRSLLDIAEVIGEPFWELAPILEGLKGHGLVKKVCCGNERS